MNLAVTKSRRERMEEADAEGSRGEQATGQALHPK